MPFTNDERQKAKDEVNDWLEGPGATVVTIILILLVIAILIAIF